MMQTRCLRVCRQQLQEEGSALCFPAGCQCKKGAFPDAPQTAPALSHAMAERKLAKAEEAEAAVRAEKIASRRAALEERVRELAAEAAERVAAVASKAAGRPPPTHPPAPALLARQGECSEEADEVTHCENNHVVSQFPSLQ
jgi:hypothetical protein